MDLIQFDGRTVAVVAPEDLEELEATAARLRTELAETKAVNDALANVAAECHALRAEIERLTSALRWEQHRAERIGTHSDTCWGWGPQHYECLLRKYNALAAGGE